MRRSGTPAPCTRGEQPASGSGLTRPAADEVAARGGPPPTVTQTAPSPAAIPVACRPTRMVRTTAFRRGSILATVPSPALRTQTAPSPTASRVGRLPTLIVAVTAFSVGSIRETAFASASATHTAPYPTAIP